MLRLLSLALTAALLSSAAYAKPPHDDEDYGNGKGKKEKPHKKQKGKFKKFSSDEKGQVQSYYQNLPKGLQKKYARTGQLPKGWQDKVKRGQPLPMAYEEELKPAPKEIKQILGEGPEGTAVMQMGNMILRMRLNDNVVLDTVLF